MLRTFCQLSPNYLQTLRELSTPEGMRLHDRIVQFPFVAPVGYLIAFLFQCRLIVIIQEEKTQEELARQAERKKEAGRRLQEMAVAKRKEKVRSNVYNVSCADHCVDGDAGFGVGGGVGVERQNEGGGGRWRRTRSQYLGFLS
jgi:hypothetical protein